MHAEDVTGDVSANLGAIRGRIVDEARHTLPGASIWIASLQEGAVSDVDGYYSLSNLDPGTYTLKVTYVGFTPKEVQVEVVAGKTVSLDIVLHEGVQLHEVSVVGAFRGQRKALNSQKNEIGIVDVVSADQIGKFPDANIGDALKRISGINVQYDQGEARFGQVRGTSADMSSVTINGNRLPSAEGDIRNVQLDLIPSDMIQTIEVNKVVTSDMDGDAIGGAINLVTKSTPYRRTFSATVGSGYNVVSDKAQLNLGLTYGDRFFKDRFGLMVEVKGEQDRDARLEVIRRRMMYERDPDGFREMYEGSNAVLRDRIVCARRSVRDMEPSESTLDAAVRISLHLGVEGHRADLTMVRAACARAALDGREEPTPADVVAVCRMVLSHRMRRTPFQDEGLAEEGLGEWLRGLLSTYRRGSR